MGQHWVGYLVGTEYTQQKSLISGVKRGTLRYLLFSRTLPQREVGNGGKVC